MDHTEKQKPYADLYQDPTISERDKYKYYIQNNPDVLAAKEKVRKIVAQRGLSAIMNDTKWLKLQSSIDKLPFPPAYVEKLVLEDQTFEAVQISDAPDWLGDWSPVYQEGMFLFFAIEYIKVRPFYAEPSGRLVVPKIVDESQEFEKLLNELHIPYEEDKGTYIIYGYK